MSITAIHLRSEEVTHISHTLHLEPLLEDEGVQVPHVYDHTPFVARLGDTKKSLE